MAHAYKAKRKNLNNPKVRTPFKGYFIIPAVMQLIEKGKGSSAPTKIKNPPHLLVFFKCFAILTSRYSFTDLIF